MNTFLVAANVLVFLAFVVHTFMGDRELSLLEPAASSAEEGIAKREKWTMVRCGWHWISIDLLFATIGLGLINFTDFFKEEQAILRLLLVYFIAYGLVWLFVIFISKPFPQRMLKLGQWLLLWGIASLIYLGQ